ncbi:MAG: hypothetical protein Q4A15_07845 [Prevotellaceae bacterium]|nr:hypothetical protein [Prevotellaceae bacterium]
MSVLKNDRYKGKLSGLVKARRLCQYTLIVCKNEKNFPKRSRWLITQPIVKEALNVFTCMRKANTVNVKTPEDYQLRRQWQVEAYSSCEALLSLIELALNTSNIPMRRVRFWTGCVIRVEIPLQGWIRSDYTKYSKIFDLPSIDFNSKRIDISTAISANVKDDLMMALKTEDIKESLERITPSKLIPKEE